MIYYPTCLLLNLEKFGVLPGSQRVTEPRFRVTLNQLRNILAVIYQGHLFHKIPQLYTQLRSSFIYFFLFFGYINLVFENFAFYILFIYLFIINRYINLFILEQKKKVRNIFRNIFMRIFFILRTFILHLSDIIHKYIMQHRKQKQLLFGVYKCGLVVD